MTDNTATIARLAKILDTTTQELASQRRTIVKLDAQLGEVEQKNCDLREDLAFVQDDLETVAEDRDLAYQKLNEVTAANLEAGLTQVAAFQKVVNARDRKEQVIVNQRAEIKDLRTQLEDLKRELPLGDGSRVKMKAERKDRGFGAIPEGALGTVITWSWGSGLAHVRWDSVDGNRPRYWGADLVTHDELELVHA